MKFPKPERFPARCTFYTLGRDIAIFKHLSIGRALVRRFLFRGSEALILQLRRLKPMGAIRSIRSDVHLSH